jgi:hypothetical protein
VNHCRTANAYTLWPIQVLKIVLLFCF